MTPYPVLVGTDLGGDPDDIRSRVHMLRCSDILRIEGIVSTTGPGSTPRAELIREWVRRVDLDHLRNRGHRALMREADVLGAVAQGAADARAPYPGNDTAGSRRIAARALAPDPAGLDRPLWVLAWGPLTSIARALHDVPDIAATIHLYAIRSNATVHDPDS